MNLEDIARHETELLELRFKDGQVVRARLIHVDLLDRREIIYEFIEETQRGESTIPSRQAGETVVASLSELAGFKVFGGGPAGF